MIELNLLPDVKLEYIKAQRMRRLAMVISFIISAVAIAILVLLIAVETYQKHTLGNLKSSVSSETSKLQSEPHINDILTVQSQLKSINTLHDKEPAATRLFDYFNELTPASVSISSLNIDFNAHTITLSGTAPSLAVVDQFVDTLKYTDYSNGSGGTGNLPAFNDVVLTSFTYNDTPVSGTVVAGSATYTITTAFDPNIFDITENVALVIPTETTTRSYLENPGPLFTSDNSSTSNGGQQ